MTGGCWSAKRNLSAPKGVRRFRFRRSSLLTHLWLTTVEVRTVHLLNILKTTLTFWEYAAALATRRVLTQVKSFQASAISAFFSPSSCSCRTLLPHLRKPPQNTQWSPIRAPISLLLLAVQCSLSERLCPFVSILYFVLLPRLARSRSRGIELQAGTVRVTSTAFDGPAMECHEAETVESCRSYIKCTFAPGIVAPHLLPIPRIYCPCSLTRECF